MPFGRRDGTARRPWRISAKLLIISSVVTVIGFSAICVNVMLDMRRGEEALARQTLENLATTIEADISRNVEIYDLSLRAVTSSMLLPEIWTVSKSIRHLILFDHATTAKHFGAIQVFDADGRLTIDASTLDPVVESRGDEDYFKVHRDNPNTGLFISRPMLFRGAYSIVLSRRISDQDGGFMGVVAGSIRFSYFHELFDRLNLDPDDTITVLKRDRTVMMRRPFDLDIIGKNLDDRKDWSADKLKVGTAFAGQGPIDTTARLYVRSGGSNPLFVVAGKPLGAVFELWQKEALRIGGVVLALALFVLGSTLVLAREISRRADAESRLEEMATTDALTGLRNRRKFDQVIDL
jgi:Cache domain